MPVGALLLILVARVPRQLLAQNAAVSGRVGRADTDAPIAGVEVIVNSGAPRAETDVAGRFVVPDVTPGRASLLFRLPGYSPARLELVLAPGERRSVLVQLDASITTLEIITATATRDERPIGDVPAAISVADTVAIREGRTVGLDETLRMMPGVQAASRYGTDDVNIGIRGSASRTLLAVRGIGIQLDGVQLTEPDGVGRLDLIELMAARQIDVVRGPVSALYGGSSGGVVNVLSRTGLDSPGITAFAEFGSYGFAKVLGSAGSSLGGGKGSVLAMGSYTRSDGYRLHSNATTERGLFNATYSPASRTTLAVDGALSSVDHEFPGQLTQAQFDADPDAAQPSAVSFDARRIESRFRLGTRVSQALNVSRSVEASGYFYYSGRSLDLRYPQPPSGGVLNLNFHRSQIGGQVTSARVGGAPVGLIGGVAYDNVFGTDRRWVGANGLKGEPSDDGYESVASLGVYGQGEWAISPSITLTFGLRYDQVSYHFESYFPGLVPSQDRDYSQLSPRTTLAWRTGPNSLIYGSVARGFEVPAIGEISDNPGSELHLLEPKTLWNFEVGGRGSLGSRLLYDAAVFYADAQGEFVPVDADGQYELKNASQSRNFGIELSLTATILSWLELSASYAYSDFRLQDFTNLVRDSANQIIPVDQSGSMLPAVPQNRVTAEARLRPVTGLLLGMQFEWQSLMYVETGNQQSGIVYAFSPGPVARPVPFRAVPPRVLMQLNAQLQLSNFQIFATIQNLFGITYVGNVLPNAPNGAFYEAGSGRWVSLGVRLGFWPNGFSGGAVQ